MSDMPHAIPPIVTKLLIGVAVLFMAYVIYGMNRGPSETQRAETNRRINVMAQQGREMEAKENAVKAEVVRGEISEMKFTVKAQFGSNRYEAVCHDIGEECVLYSSRELPLYKPFQSYTVEKKGRLEYTMNNVNQSNGATWSTSVMRMTYQVQ